VDNLGAGGSGSGSNSSGEVDIDSEGVSTAVLEEEERQRQEIELGQDEAMARLLTEQGRALGGEIRKRVEAMDADEDLGDQSSSGNSGGVAGGNSTGDTDAEVGQSLDEDALGDVDVLCAAEKSFLEKDAEEEEEQLVCIYPQPELASRRFPREAKEKAKADQEKRDRQGRWGGSSGGGDSDYEDENELIAVVIDKDNCPGKLHISQQQQRLGVQLAKQKQSRSVLLADRMGVGMAVQAQQRRKPGKSDKFLGSS
jgi:hypothetical protein